MPSIDCSVALCTKCITNSCITFSGDDFVAETFELPPLESFQRVAVITEAPDIRLGGTSGTAGLFTNACADTRREDWLVTVSTCDTKELECYLAHGDCWRFRWHQDCALAHSGGDKGYDMEVGQVSFDQAWNFSNNTTDPVLLAFTITGLTPTYPHGFVCDVDAPQCDESPLPAWLDNSMGDPEGEGTRLALGNSCTAPP